MFRLPLPPLDEQRGDCRAFLDRETERIDALVAKKRQLIERLQEYRTALITRTVTRGLPPDAARAAGLDPSPRLKPSGVEWLGDVPEHWEVKSGTLPCHSVTGWEMNNSAKRLVTSSYDGDRPCVTNVYPSVDEIRPMCSVQRQPRRQPQWSCRSQTPSLLAGGRPCGDRHVAACNDGSSLPLPVGDPRDGATKRLIIVRRPRGEAGRQLRPVLASSASPLTRSSSTVSDDIRTVASQNTEPAEDSPTHPHIATSLRCRAAQQIADHS